MAATIERTADIGLCFGVKRAIDILKKAACHHGGVETLGAVVHNRQVLERLARMGVEITPNVESIKGNTVVVSAHGISPHTEAEIKKRGKSIIDTTCPFVRRAQASARELAQDGFFVVIYGDANHPEVKGALGWANGNGRAMLEAKGLSDIEPLPPHLGILSQTTQIPQLFEDFLNELKGLTRTRGSELKVVDTICPEIKRRQKQALKLAGKADLMLVIGSSISANTGYLVRLCSELTPTHLVERPEDIQPSWIEGRRHIGITSGASTATETIYEVADRLETLTTGLTPPDKSRCE